MSWLPVLLLPEPSRHLQWELLCLLFYVLTNMHNLICSNFQSDWSVQTKEQMDFQDWVRWYDF